MSKKLQYSPNSQNSAAQGLSGLMGAGLNPIQLALVRRIAADFQAACPQAKVKDYEIFCSQVAAVIRTYDQARTQRIDELESLVMQHVALSVGRTFGMKSLSPAENTDISGNAILALQKAEDTTASVAFDEPLATKTRQ